MVIRIFSNNRMRATLRKVCSWSKNYSAMYGRCCYEFYGLHTLQQYSKANNCLMVADILTHPTSAPSIKLLLLTSGY